jgi:MoaA/NifB/PqqE/SkfB family radical SAM enzyme
MPTTSPPSWQLVPAACDVLVTNACNAACDFCSFARQKHVHNTRGWIERSELARALPILHTRGIRYLNFQGGEPLLHPEVDGLVADAHAAKMRPTIITNGWLLPNKLESLINAGLHTLLISIDSHSMAEHERNRGLPRLGDRIRDGLRLARKAGLPTIASVTINRLLCFEELPALLRELDFDAVRFTYPRRQKLGSTSLVYEENSKLIDFSDAELIEGLKAVERFRKHFRVMNPKAGLEEIERHIRGEVERFACVGGYKYFYLDWDLNIWRCEAWSEPMGSVFDFETIPDQRDHCTACMTACYRDASVLMHAGVAATDAVRALVNGEVGQAARLMFRRSVAESLGAVAGNLGMIKRLA